MTLLVLLSGSRGAGKRSLLELATCLCSHFIATSDLSVCLSFRLEEAEKRRRAGEDAVSGSSFGMRLTANASYQQTCLSRSNFSPKEWRVIGPARVTITAGVFHQDNTISTLSAPEERED